MLIPVDELKKRPYSLVLAYPRPWGEVVEHRIEELKALGIAYLDFSGRKEVSGLKVLGKGCVGLVVAARTSGGREVAVKIRRLDADRESMAHEAEMLALANSVGVGPELLRHTDDFIVMEFIDGPHLPEWLSSGPEPGEVAAVLRALLEKCRRLDEVGLDHGELSRAYSHIIIQARPGMLPEPRIVDFESASTFRRPANVTSICQFLFIGGISAQVALFLGKRDRNAIIRALRAYKRGRGLGEFQDVLRACGLSNI